MPLRDEALGDFHLSGHWSPAPGAREAVVLLHGLGGDTNSPYLRRMSHCARQLGLSVLHLNLRGADQQGPDMYHAGQWQDVAHSLTCSELADCERIHIVGYSLGGHIALRCAAHCDNARLGNVVSICAPLDLALATDAFSDWPPLYASHIMRSLKASYRAVAERWRRLDRWSAPSASEAQQIATVRQWDELIVAPRHGYRDVHEYYSQESASKYLADIKRPSLILVTDSDPMVPLHTLVDALRTRSPEVQLRRFAEGGHLGFPRSLQPSVEEQVLEFLQ